MIYLVLMIIMFAVMISYFKVANHYNIIDRPNERSSHTEVTIRGGGVIFLFAALCALILHPESWMIVLGMFTIGVISFIDDRITLPSKTRIIFHLTAVTMMFFSLGILQLLPWYICAALYILVIGVINAYNFMDGINGITGLYSLVVLSGLQYLNYKVFPFINTDLIWLPIMACCVFLFFNFRKRAKCFAGDVGSVTIAFYITYLILNLIIQTGNYAYILFLAVYGVDAVLTIIHRLILKQNIFDAHRLHFYQILANEQKWSHLYVSILYTIMQLVIILIIIFVPLGLVTLFLLSTLPLVLAYIILKPRLMLKA
jgi:UDP-N-acetylmuramyl pentapeptide phosphotransferase/UDP-N-acetylglucosamine-1-phosphate transferase